MKLDVKKGFAGIVDQDIQLIQKSSSRLMRLIGFFYPPFVTNLWTTIGNKIYYPDTTDSPLALRNYPIIEHEMVHVRQYNEYGVPLFLFLYLFFPLPCFFSYFRWKFEREAYFKANIKKKEDIDRVVESLRTHYLYPWPQRWMRKWFTEQLERRTNERNS